MADCDHDDVSLEELLGSFTSHNASKSYYKALQDLMTCQNKVHFDRMRLNTGISKPSIFLGLDECRMLGIPALFTGDIMHLAALNIPDLLIKLCMVLLTVMHLI